MAALPQRANRSVGEKFMKRNSFLRICFVLFVTLGMLSNTAVHAEDEAPDALIKRLSVDVLESIKADKSIRAGDVTRVVAHDGLCRRPRLAPGDCGTEKAVAR
jgi:hypothetical protein